MMNDITRTAAADGEPGKPAAVTGDPHVDEALDRIAGLGEVPDTEHVEAFEEAHRRLHGLLDELDTRHDPGEVSDGQAEQA
jgi:hypothetical protein